MSNAHIDQDTKRVSVDRAMAIIREHYFNPEVNTAEEISFDVLPADEPEAMFETVPITDGYVDVADLRSALGY